MKDFDNHIKNDHFKNYCNICSRSTPLDILDHVQTECIYRTISCKYCDKKLIGPLYIDHLIIHLDESKNRLSLLKDVYEKENKLYENIVKQIKIMYENIYNSPYHDE